MTRLIGIAAYHPDAAAAAVLDGAFVAGVEEERFRRIKHWAGLPTAAIAFCRGELGVEWSGVDAVAVARQPRAYLWRKAWLALSHPRSLRRAAARARNLGEIGGLGLHLAREFNLRQPPRVIPVEHHMAHLGSAFYCSPFDEAACLSVDGFGDFVSTMIGRGRDRSIEVLRRIHYPHSLGLFYTAMTQYLGFLNFGDEYKVMGLAAYGQPRFHHQLADLVHGLPDGGFALDLRYFSHLSQGVSLSWPNGSPEQGLLFTPRLEALLGPARRPQDELTQRHKDLAASMQSVYEERFFALVRLALEIAGTRKLALAGGCALNSLANGKLFAQTDVEEIFIQAAAGDAGTSLGAALCAHHGFFGGARGFVMEHASWGPSHDELAIRQAIADGIPGSLGRDGSYEDLRIETHSDPQSLCDSTADALASGEVIGWYQGRAEWGPRALGNRSILADPRRSDMQDLLNRKIKRRESFRPFAPSILVEEVAHWFTQSYPDPFMLKVYPIRPEKRAQIPAVCHVDGTGRLQTVSDRSNALYARLIRAFQQHTGVPMLLNTSFNENEPIVNTPSEALACFLRTRMDRLVLGPIIVRRVPA